MILEALERLLQAGTTRNDNSRIESLFLEYSSVQARLQFARHSFDNIQRLIRFVDQKASLILVVAGLFAAGYFPVIASSFDGYRETAHTALLMALLAFWFILRLAITILFCLLVFVPRLGPMTNRVDAPEMLFPLMILRKYSDGERDFFANLCRTSEVEFLADYSQQIMATSAIYQAKHRNLTSALKATFRTVLAWAVGLTVAAGDRLLHVFEVDSRALILALVAISLVLFGRQVIERFTSSESLVPDSRSEYFQEINWANDL